MCEHPCRVPCVNLESPLTLGLSGVCHPGGTFGSTRSALPCGRKQPEAVAAAAGEALWSPAPGHGTTPCRRDMPACGTWMCGLCAVISAPRGSHVVPNVVRTFSLRQVWSLSGPAVRGNA